MRGDCAILIPARAASTRLPEKLLLSETGRALLTYAVEAAEHARDASAGRVVEVIVAAADERLVDVVEAFARERGLGARAVLTSPEHPSGTDRIAEVARDLPESIRLLINIQGDEPDLPPGAILRVAALLDEHPEAAMSTLVRPIRARALYEDPNAVKAVLDRRGRCLLFSRAPVPHYRDGCPADGNVLGHLHLGIYGYRREILLNYAELPASRLEACERLEQMRALEAGLVLVADETDYDGTGIDTPGDYQAFVRRLAEGDAARGPRKGGPTNDR